MFRKRPVSHMGFAASAHRLGRQSFSPNVPADMACQLATLITEQADVRCRQYGDVYHTLSGPINEFTVPEVRPLNLEDEGLLAAYRSDPREMGFATFEDLLTNGAQLGPSSRAV